MRAPAEPRELTDELRRAIPAIQDVFLALPRTGRRHARRRSLI
jgi:hypothetical protein